jgi:hypothetical protein
MDSQKVDCLQAGSRSLSMYRYQYMCGTRIRAPLSGYLPSRFLVFAKPAKLLIHAKAFMSIEQEE